MHVCKPVCHWGVTAYMNVCVCCEKKPGETECDEDRQTLIRWIRDRGERNGEGRICNKQVVMASLWWQSWETQWCAVMAVNVILDMWDDTSILIHVASKTKTNDKRFYSMLYLLYCTVVTIMMMMCGVVAWVAWLLQWCITSFVIQS